MSIIAKKVIVIQNNGFKNEYTHVTSIATHLVKDTEFLYIDGETEDFAGMGRVTYDKHFIKDIQLTIIEWHIPKT